MSAPSTLPQHTHNHQLQFGYSPHQSYQSDRSQRAHPVLNGASRLRGSHPSIQAPGNTSSSVIESPQSSEETTQSPKSDYYPADMPASSVASANASSSKKRRPDWNEFYKNGLPSEVICLDITPEPTTSVGPNGTANPSVADARHAAKKRKRDDAYDAVFQDGSSSHSNHQTPQFKNSASGSTISTDRTTSAVHTTAATSLGSLSSNGQNGFDAAEAQPGQKRKRMATRTQLANEAKRKELEVNGDAFANYKAPPKPPIKAAEVIVKQVYDTPQNKNSKIDDDDGHYIVVPDTDLTERYQVTKLLGQGTFGKVVQARDRRKGNKLVAIKIIRSVQKYRDASRIELRVLSTLKANDAENRNRCIHLRDCFDYRGHICIVMDLLGQSVFDFLKGNSFVPFPNSQIQSFARQLFTSVAFLHDLNLIHTDLKPENILLCGSGYQAFTYSRRIPSSSTTVNRQAAQRRVLLDTEIRLIDFGSATFQDEYHSSVVSTRHYRAPEIILGLGWSFPCDIWSIGCILVEFFTGDALFQTHDNLEHLAMMEAVVNEKLDTHLVQQVNNMNKRSTGNPAARFFKRLRLDYPQADTTRASKKFVKAMKRLDEIIPENSRFSRNFVDLLKQIFVYDPNRRITAKQALQHPWFKEAATPDDGTEATKIRMQRLAQEQAACGITATGHPGGSVSRHNGYH